MHFEVDHCLLNLLCQGWRYLGALYKMMYLDDFSDREKIGDRLTFFFPKDNFINYIKKSNHKKREVSFFYFLFYCIVGLLLTL